MSQLIIINPTKLIMLIENNNTIIIALNIQKNNAIRFQLGFDLK